MGIFAHWIGVSRVLFAGRRVGDVTPPLVILYLLVLTISYGNIVWNMFYEVGDFSELPQGKK